jgi:TonB family protein
MTSASFLPLLTAVSWTTVATVGTTGLVLAPAEPAPVATVATAVLQPVKEFTAKLTMGQDDSAEPDNKPKSEQAVVEQVLNDAPPAAPACAAMAEGSQVAFAIPVAAPSSIVGKNAASGLTTPGVVGGVPGGVAGGMPVTKITLGKGFGSGLPAPAYPETARLNGWEGSVTVRFALDSSGHILVAKVVSSSGRPVLDEEALNTVKRRWNNKFPAGSPPGPFDWTAHFVLN